MQEATRRFTARAEAADYPAVIDDSGTWMARALLAEAEPLAEALRGSAGPRPTVLLQADNSWRTLAVALAVGRLGGTIAVANSHTTPAEFAAAREDIAPDAVVADAERLAAWHVSDHLPDTYVDGWRIAPTPTGRDCDRWAGGVLIGLTSGSTGRPKGVVQSESALRYASEREIEAAQLSEGDAVAAIVPLSSTASYCFGVYTSMLLGGPLVLWHRWDPATVLARMESTRAAWTMCVPTMVLQLAAAVTDDQKPPLHAVHAITVGGGPMRLEALEDAENRLGTTILRVFGMSECLGHTSPRLDEPAAARLSRDGYPFAGTDVRAVDADGRPLPPGEPGAAQVRGPSLFLGYARDGAVSPPTLTPDGFFPTGDSIVIERDGAVRVTGRIKDMIIRGGRNIDVVEVEHALCADPRIRQACVVPVPDDLLGERVAALVVTTDPAAADLAEVTARLGAYGLAKTKWPEFVFRVPAIPQTRVGKVAREEAKRIAAELHSGVSQ